MKVVRRAKLVTTLGWVQRMACRSHETANTSISSTDRGMNHRRLRHPLTSSEDYYEFEGTATEYSLVDGAGKSDEAEIRCQGDNYVEWQFGFPIQRHGSGAFTGQTAVAVR